MRVDQFDYDLPEERIALTPAKPRDAARLLHVSRSGLADKHVRELPLLLRGGDLLVLNDTKVIPAQLFGTRPARAAGAVDPQPVAIDVTLHKRLQTATSSARWKAFVRPAKRVHAGDRLDFTADFSAEVERRDGAEAVLRFNIGGKDFDAALAAAGAPPLPPYIARKRQMTAADAHDYQTVYADEPGSVAAPTAGLHFTDRLFAALDERGVKRVAVTLHVGAGTFLPVTADDTRDHVMHAEWGEITEAQADAINAVKARGGRVIAVGTTALRLLESAVDEQGRLRPYCADTDIFITPGYKFRIADLLLTNFHLPRSTLFMLVCGFAGVERMKTSYAHAIDAEYRFYSYGDACLLERADD